MPQLAAIDYADWRTEKSGDRWRFRLPTDLEWEKAARGQDRRAYVWGNYLIWNYSWSQRGSYRRVKTPRAVGSTPTDESVYGIRDLAGSAKEHTTSIAVEGFRFTALRGGDWYTIDEFNWRVATRNGTLPTNGSLDAGIRLAADLEKP